MSPPRDRSSPRSRCWPSSSERAWCAHIGLSNVTPAQIEEGRRIVPIVCVQNACNVAHRTDDDLIDALARDDIAYVPFFPLGGFNPLPVVEVDSQDTALRSAMRVADALAPASPHFTALKAMPSAPATRSPGRRHTG